LSLTVENEFVGIRNVKIENALESTTALDIKRDAVYNSGTTKTDGKAYDTYPTLVLNTTDGYYHVGSVDGPILLVDILNTTAWSVPHTGKKTVTLEASATEYGASPFYIDFCQWEADTQNLSIIWNNVDYTDYCIDNFYYQQYSTNSLLPVTEKLKQMLIDFTREYAVRSGTLSTWYEDQWVEFCSYYDHVGADHTSGDACNAYDDPVKGMTYSNAYTAVEGTNNVTITLQVGMNKYAGVLYKFVPEHTGVYLIQSISNTSIDDPYVYLMDADGVMLAYENDPYFYNSTVSSSFDFYLYYYFTAGETYYLRVSLGTNTTGTFEFDVNYTGEQSYKIFVLASDHEMPGIWTISLDAYESGNFDDTTYGIATNIGLNTNDKDGAIDKTHSIYYAVDDNNEFTSPIYIDFVHPTLLFTSGESLYDMIVNGYFNLPDTQGALTEIMLQYYEASIAGKSEDDELYGMVKADSQLVYYLCSMLDYQKSDTTNDSRGTNFWMIFGCYYMTIDSTNSHAISNG
jgi:hypothetical protein